MSIAENIAEHWGFIALSGSVGLKGIQSCLPFRDTFSKIRELILVCGERLCSAIFKKWSAISVNSRKLEKNVIEQNFFLKIDFRRSDSNRRSLASKSDALTIQPQDNQRKKF